MGFIHLAIHIQPAAICKINKPAVLAQALSTTIDFIAGYKAHHALCVARLPGLATNIQPSHLTGASSARSSTAGQVSG